MIVQIIDKRFVFRRRELRYLFRREWWGVRAGHYPKSQSTYQIYDLGCFSVGRETIVTLRRF